MLRPRSRNRGLSEVSALQGAPAEPEPLAPAGRSQASDLALSGNLTAKGRFTTSRGFASE